MKKTKLLSIAGLLIAAATITTAFKSFKANDNKGFAVVELFTSEGCSDCPSADAVIAKLNKETTDKPVYILAYHVDYWDRNGWRDAFSSAAYTARQYDYVKWLRLSSAYTPQVVVNGKTEFVGSQEGMLRSVIQNDLKSQSKATLNLDHASASGNTITVNYHASEGKNIKLVTALIQPFGQTNVKGGENEGRKLSHVQIVRQVQQLALNQKDGSISISAPKGIDIKTWQVIGFLQDTRNGEILGASKIALN